VATDAFPVRLVCPRCRVPGSDGRLVVSLLEELETGRDGADLCPRCRTRYPRVDGIRCVPPDLPAFLAAQGAELAGAGRRFAPGEAAERCAGVETLDPAGDAFREACLVAQHALAHFPPRAGPLADELAANGALPATLAAWVGRHVRPVPGAAPCLLDAGCGPGAFLHAAAPLFPDGAVGLDLRVSSLRLARRLADHGEATAPFRVEGRRVVPLRIAVPAEGRAPAGRIHLVQGDLLDPPFGAGSFAAVAAISILDAVSDPVVALGQLDALLAPGGLLLVGAPWSWDARVTPATAWWSGPDGTAGEVLRALLAGRHPALPHLGYELLEEADRAPWAIPGHGRLVHRYALELLLARRRA